MNYRPIAHVAAAFGLVLAGLTLSTGTAVAAAPTCSTSVMGVLPDGRLVDRWLTNTRQDKEFTSADPLPFSVDNMVFLGSDQVTGGHVRHLNTFSSGTAPRTVDETRLDASPTMTFNVATVYARAFTARLVAGSGRFYVYSVDRHGKLMRWTRQADSAGHVWFGEPKLVARHQGGLKTLSYSWTFKIGGGWKDVLYGTTRSGALKQFKISWKQPASAKVTTVKRSGFASYTGLSLSICNNNSKYVSIIGIDAAHNQARWYTLQRSLSRHAKLRAGGSAAPGAEWRLHAAF